jgi:hypothetical protein
VLGYKALQLNNYQQPADIYEMRRRLIDVVGAATHRSY